MTRIWLFLALGLFVAQFAAAQPVLPERRIVVSPDMDFYGADLQPLFDTTLPACQSACLNDAACGAFTFNTRSKACFPKTGVLERSPFQGAVSAVVIATDPAALARGAARAADLDFLGEAALGAARDEAGALGARHGGGQWTAPELRDAAHAAEARGNLRDALQWTGAALARADDGTGWLAYGRMQSRIARDAQVDTEARTAQDRARLAAINAYLRLEGDAQRAEALMLLADALEATGAPRLTVPALRLAQRLSPSPAVNAALDRAIAQFGFRITGHVVETDSAAPRICAEFSDPLIRVGRDYAPFVRLPDPVLAVTAEDRRLCITGVSHGARYRLTFRAGLPSAGGETLARDVEITAYVRDRDPSVRFPGRAYVLPKTERAGLPVETVNLSEVALTLFRVSDRNLVRAMQDSYFGKPLSGWALDRFSRDLAERVWTGRGETGNRLNADMTTRLPMQDILRDMPAGIYALSAAVPGADPYDDGAATQWFVLSDIGLTTLDGADGLTVFARGLGDAAPMAGLEVALISRANAVLGRAVTDVDGVARFAAGLTRGPAGAAPALVTATRGDTDIAFLSLTDPAFDLSDRGVAGRAPSGPLDAFLTTDRGAYRTGETIHATALLRDAQVRAVPDVPLTVVLTRPDGVEQTRRVSTDPRAGGHVFDLPLPPAVPRGTWRLELFADPDAAALATSALLVEDFTPERIDVTLSLPADLRVSGALLTVDARYLFGAPGADLAIEGDLTLLPKSTLEAFPGYRFGRHDDDATPQAQALPGDLRTDASGHATVPLTLPDTPMDRPQEARVTLRVTEGSGRPVERALTRAVPPRAPLIGIRPEADGTLAENAEAGFALIAVGPDLTPVPMQVDWQVNRVTTRYQWYQLYGNWNWEPITTRETVARGSATLGDDPVRVAADVTWGDYEIVVGQTGGTGPVSSTGFEAGWYAPAGAVATPDTLDLSLDKDRYRAGDTAHLRVVPRDAGAALVTVLSDRVIAARQVTLPAGETVIDLPVTVAWGAGAYVTVQMVRPMDVAAGQAPARSLGLAHAALDPGASALAVQLDTPAQSAPRGPLTATVTVDGIAEGDTAWVTVAAVDLGILNLTGFDSPNPSAHYFGQQRLAVEIRDIYGRLIDGMNGAMGQIRSGGDAGSTMRMQAPPPTEDLVAQFSGPVQIRDGKAELRFDMPDFNGTVRLMAVAWSDGAVGQATADVLVRDPVVMTASLPRFLAPGDTTRLRLDLTHVSGPAGAMPLDIDGDGLTPGPAPEMALSEGKSQTLTVPLTAPDVAGDHVITLTLTLPGGERLQKRLTVGVRATDPAVGRTRRLVLGQGQSFVLDDAVLDGLRPDGAEVLVSAGPLARLDVPGLLASLNRYPYGCTEQVTSKALPLLYLGDAAQALGMGDAGRIARRIDDAIGVVLARQSANGAFGLWQAGSGDFWLDAYVTDFLSRAQAAGHTIPDRAMHAALDNLSNRIAYAPDFDDGGEDIAYALLVLAREGRAAVADLRYYADERGEALATALARAQLGAALASYGDQPRADAMFTKAAAALSRTPETGWRDDYGSQLRDAAGLLSLAASARSQVIDREAAITRISAGDRPLSTQEQAWSLLAAHALTDAPDAGLMMDGVPVSGPLIRRIPGDALGMTEITNTGPGPVPLTITALGVPGAGTPATGYGYAISRDYYTMAGAPVDGPVAQGDRLVTVLTVRPADDRHARLMIDDALPAGFEIDNPSLLRAGDIRALDWLQTSDVENAEFRAERFMAAVTRAGADPIRLAYIVRAVSVGTFHHPAALAFDMYRPEYRATTASGTLEIR
ncbi:alpha-2-macroglobulin family protein [Salipiger aestuarii]|uniref:alpha-2-macroglobulin family protein n=1 Tax=Salipiger aestuarii TaxID=568098 RepID=UPI00123B75E8|nr:alpha-2-macroglobulin family protein [Salipiger aestuarii]KAA8610737.1 PAN domain-containing protein [Salipiger aestuarii]